MSTQKLFELEAYKNGIELMLSIEGQILPSWRLKYINLVKKLETEIKEIKNQ